MPDELQIMKGSKNVALERSMVKLIVNNPISWALENYLRSAFIADEHFYQSLIDYALKVKAVRLPNEDFDIAYVRHSVWESAGDKICDGKMIREVCNFAVGDLSRTAKSKKMQTPYIMYAKDS